MSRTSCIALLIAAAMSGLSLAQTTWSIEGLVPSLGEYNSPPPCGLVPPYTALLPSVTPCQGLTAFPNLSCQVGGNAVDNDGNYLSGGPSFPVIVACDGFELVMTTDTGVFLSSAFVSPLLPAGLISGVAQDSVADITYLTDGNFVIGLYPPPGPPGCGPPAVAVPPFPLQLPLGWPPVCGLAFDPCTGTLWTCDSSGFVGNYTTSGSFLPGSFVLSFLLPPPHTGITVNTTNGHLQVTNGYSVIEVTPAGALAAPGAFYLSANPYPIPSWGGGGADGLGFSLRPIRFGVGCPPPSPPSIDFAGGYPYAGNSGFTVFESGATPGKVAFLLVSFGYSCPQLPFGGCSPGFAVSLPWYTLISVGLIPASGGVAVTLPIPPPSGPCGLPVGASLFMQFVNAGPFEMTGGLGFTIGVP